jgi:hypothetical protein
MSVAVFFSPLLAVGLMLAREVASQASAPNVVRTPVTLGDTSGHNRARAIRAMERAGRRADCAVPINMLNLASQRRDEHSRGASVFRNRSRAAAKSPLSTTAAPASPQRNVAFIARRSSSYDFDPNRVFTKRGREISLGATGAPEAAVGAYVSHAARRSTAGTPPSTSLRCTTPPARTVPTRTCPARATRLGGEPCHCAGRHVDAALSHARQHV